MKQCLVDIYRRTYKRNYETKQRTALGAKRAKFIEGRIKGRKKKKTSIKRFIIT